MIIPRPSIIVISFPQILSSPILPNIIFKSLPLLEPVGGEFFWIRDFLLRRSCNDFQVTFFGLSQELLGSDLDLGWGLVLDLKNRESLHTYISRVHGGEVDLSPREVNLLPI
jgi:hypothetical protein